MAKKKPQLPRPRRIRDRTRSLTTTPPMSAKAQQAQCGSQVRRRVLPEWGREWSRPESAEGLLCVAGGRVGAVVLRRSVRRRAACGVGFVAGHCRFDRNAAGSEWNSKTGEAIASPRRAGRGRRGRSGGESDIYARLPGKTAGEMGHPVRFESHPPHQKNRSELRKRDSGAVWRHPSRHGCPTRPSYAGRHGARQAPYGQDRHRVLRGRLARRWYPRRQRERSRAAVAAWPGQRPRVRRGAERS